MDKLRLQFLQDAFHRTQAHLAAIEADCARRRTRGKFEYLIARGALYPCDHDAPSCKNYPRPQARVIVGDFVWLQTDAYPLRDCEQQDAPLFSARRI